LVLHSETTPLLSPSKALIVPLSQKTPAKTAAVSDVQGAAFAKPVVFPYLISY